MATRGSTEAGAGGSRSRREPQSIDRRELERLIFYSTALRRFTQDSPILPDVWFEFGATPAARLDLLLTPNRTSRDPSEPGDLYRVLEPHLDEAADLAYNQSTAAAKVTFRELVRVVMPLANWRLEFGSVTDAWLTIASADERARDRIALALMEFEAGHTQRIGPERPPAEPTIPTVLWAIRIVGTIELARQGRLKSLTGRGSLETALSKKGARLLVDTVAGLIDGGATTGDLVFSVSRNRRASVTVFRSVPTVKGDAARGLFPVDFGSLKWAVIDSGIDARHPAFRRRDRATPGKTFLPKAFEDPTGKPVNNSRIVETYDFTGVRELVDRRRLEGDRIEDPELRKRLKSHPDARAELIETLRAGRPVRWTRFTSLIQIPHAKDEYLPPAHEHGTHVAGILAGDWRQSDAEIEGWKAPDHDLIGVCPELELYDLRVLGEDGTGDEFAVSAAIQFLQTLTTERDYLTVHGVNISLAIKHDVANYACGRTPVCEEAERLVSSGVLVVAAAGNEGYKRTSTEMSDIAEGYRTVSITDPGNSEAVITVGSTHGYRPYAYGVSYFSSRGPTGDGRAKPDLVAPGEKIWSAVPDGGVRTLDGTSMASPHVSGCAALLMARYRELIGDPARVKDILCSTASDLGRERYFQGHGLVDVLRAMQSL